MTRRLAAQPSGRGRGRVRSGLRAASGSDVYESAPPLAGATVTGAVVFYSLGAYAPEREARTGPSTGGFPAAARRFG